MHSAHALFETLYKGTSRRLEQRQYIIIIKLKTTMLMEKTVRIIAVGAYAERQYQKQDGSTEYFKSRGVVMRHGGDNIYGEMTGEVASKNRDTQYYQDTLYVVKGFWKHRTWQDKNGEERHENAFYITDLQTL